MPAWNINALASIDLLQFKDIYSSKTIKLFLISCRIYLQKLHINKYSRLEDIYDGVLYSEHNIFIKYGITEKWCGLDPTWFE